MLTAMVSLAAISSGLGLVLGVAARKLHVEGDSRVEAVMAMLPSANCGQCGFPGCGGAAEAIVAGEASPSCCPPGGKVVAQTIASYLGVTVSTDGEVSRPTLAVVTEALCIGCNKCFRLCPSDAIIGASKQIHVVMEEACTGCNQCAEKCPTEAISMVEVPETLGTWVMPKPKLAS